jgi:hypothetical protein
MQLPDGPRYNYEHKYDNHLELKDCSSKSIRVENAIAYRFMVHVHGDEDESNVVVFV